MDLRTYRSKTMAGALAEVKKDLGPDAVILRTRTYKAGGVLGFGGNAIVEITAAREAPEGKVYTPPRRFAPRKPEPETPAEAPAVARAAAVADLPMRRSVPPAPVAPVRVEAEQPASKVGEPLAATRVEFSPVSADAQAALESELSSIRQLVSQVLLTTRRTAVHLDGADGMGLWATGRPDPLFDLYSVLIDRETPESTVDELIAAVRDELDPDERRDKKIVRETALRHLGARLRIAPPCEAVEGPVVEALIGPTGVGKTTTIAKLAAAHKLRYGRHVGLITADTYRIAAVEQLRTYAGIIGIPLEVALSPDEMGQAREKLAGCDVILIDTPGRSPRDTGRLEALAEFLAAGAPTRTHLVLSAGASRGVLRSAVDRFAPAGPDCMVLSKLDEASGLGVICLAAETAGLPLSYVTTGQEVPDHIEPARAERLARLVLEGEVGP